MGKEVRKAVSVVALLALVASCSTRHVVIPPSAKAPWEPLIGACEVREDDTVVCEREAFFMAGVEVMRQGRELEAQKVQHMAEMSLVQAELDDARAREAEAYRWWKEPLAVATFILGAAAVGYGVGRIQE